MTLERHSVYFVPPRASASTGSIVGGEEDGSQISPESSTTATTVQLKIFNHSSAMLGQNSARTKTSKSHFVSWRVSAPSISTIGTQQYALSTQFPALLPPVIGGGSIGSSRSSLETSAEASTSASAISSTLMSNYSTSALNPASSPYKQQQSHSHLHSVTDGVCAAHPSTPSPAKSRNHHVSPSRASNASASRQRTITEETTTDTSVTASPRTEKSSASSHSQASRVSSETSSIGEIDSVSSSTKAQCSCRRPARAVDGEAKAPLSRSSSYVGSEASLPPLGPGSIASSVGGNNESRTNRGHYEREYESIIVANAVQPSSKRNIAADGKNRQGNGATPVPILKDTPGLLLGKHHENDIFTVTRTNSVLLRRKDLQWYLDKVLWKLGVHKKARRDFLAYWLPRFRNEEYVAVRFIPSEDFSPCIPFDYTTDYVPLPATSALPASEATLPLHRVFALFRRVSVPEVSGWTYTVRGGSSTQGVIDWSETCRMPEGWAVDDRVPLLLEVGALDTGGRSYFFD